MEIRIIPMSKDEFEDKTFINVQNDFFLKDLPKLNKGKFKYRQSGLAGNDKDLLLFQYDSRIIAMATLKEVEKFDNPKGANKEYLGAYHVYPNTIAIFTPITEIELKSIFPNDFNGFCHTKYKLPITELPILMKLINLKHVKYFNVDI